MPEGKCVCCGRKFYGWALEERILYCDSCGTVILLTKGEYRWVREVAS